MRRWDLSERPSRSTAASHRPASWWGVVVFAALVMLAVGMGQTSFGHAVLRKTGLSGEPTSFTSLAFVHPQSLPGQLSSQPENVSVSFVIRNSGESTRNYHWSVRLTQGGHTRQTAEGSVRIPPRRQTAINRLTSISCAAGQLQIMVSLARPAEHIDALAACRARKG